ncbi:hypothetical protein BSK63_16880 [Paenibacillus odorifer]|uniref:Uncharacterized protein n=1 Tax=Paenibacillus odorifer TaxID=189426 RepID=A0A1R0X1Q8_9BACL|nr:hypothetical protein [Paenibacillus odorifer]OMD26728.1 hypothetical protein BJP51_26410 [Paenibacillus odorifer]OME30569.1 hypothetical protein BSK63_16880 [Paenibacillus odorifer]OME32626.1 hypothetical protein BSK58_27965 [Paenibacillus odorifer]
MPLDLPGIRVYEEALAIQHLLERGAKEEDNSFRRSLYNKVEALAETSPRCRPYFECAETANYRMRLHTEKWRLYTNASFVYH